MQKFSDEVQTKTFQFQNPYILKGDLDEILTCERMVFAFPLYVDGLPSHFISCLKELEHAFFEMNAKSGVSTTCMAAGARCATANGAYGLCR